LISIEQFLRKPEFMFALVMTLAPVIYMDVPCRLRGEGARSDALVTNAERSAQQSAAIVPVLQEFHELICQSKPTDGRVAVLFVLPRPFGRKIAP